MMSATLFVLSLVMPLPREARLVLYLGLTFGWLGAGSFWLVQRYERQAGAAIAALVLLTCGGLGAAYWRDTPNRRLASQIEQIPGCYVRNPRGLVTGGKVEDVYISADASDEDVARFIDLEGLGDLHYLFLNGTPIRDATARRLGTLRSLRYLSLAHTGVNEETADELRRALPDCDVEIR